MGISNKIKVATISADETTIYEIKAMIALPFHSCLTTLVLWWQQRCYFLFITFSFPLLSSWLLELVSSILRKTCLICNNFLDKTNNLMVCVQRKGQPQLWVPIEKLPSGGSKLSGKRGGSFLIQTQKQERVPLWKTIFSTLQASVSGFKIRWQPPPPPQKHHWWPMALNNNYLELFNFSSKLLTLMYFVRFFK